MKQNNTQTIFIHTNITLICIILLSTGSSGADYRYEACVPKNCGRGPNITFPFYIPGLQEPYCGYPGFALACTPPRNSPVLHFPGIEYEVEDIFYHTRSLRVYNLVLSSLSSNGTNTNCLPDIRNTTVPPTQFDFADNVTRLHLFSNCSDRFISNSSSSLGLCGDRAWMYEEDERYGRAVESCRRNVVAPVEMGAVGWDVVEVMKKGFVLKWKASVCSKCERSGGRCGFNETIYHFRCFCPDRPHSRRCKPEKSRTTAIIATAISGSLVFILCLLIPFIIWKCKKRITISCVVSRKESFDPSSKTDIEGGSYFGIPVFCYAQLEEATNSFDASKELGDGGFGTVYYGKLRDGREVAVKRLYKHDYRTMDQFINEIKILTCLRHKNLVSLYGCTSRRSKDLLLVYEYIPNGTVADHLHGGKSPLPWPVRMNIAVETASALAYLHKSDIIHRDVKTDNILLDANFCVKVADFGLSRLFPNDVTHISTAPQGTPGYVDPEYHQCYRLTDRSDVYSFGVVLIELISSMRAVDIGRQRDEVNLANLAVSRIQRRAFDELIDPSLGYECDEGVRRMTNSVAELAFRCLQVEMEMRPSMDEVLEILKEIRGGDELKFEKNKGTNLNILITEEGKNFHSSPIAVIGTWYSSASTTGSVG